MTWVIDALGRIKVTPGIHDHSSVIAGGDDLNPETITAQTYIVGPAGVYTTLGAAVTAVNAAGPPDAANPYVIRMMGGITAETGAVTIPAYCHVIGMEEGSTIGMGANTLHVSDNAGLYNVKVTSTAQVSIQINNASPLLRNVYVRNTKAGAPVATLFLIMNASSPRLYDCVAETTTNFMQAGFGLAGTGSPELYRCQVVRTGGTTAAPFSITDTCTPLLEHCIADDTTNFTTALAIDNTATTVTTRHCTFRAAAAGNDVSVGAAATWVYHQDDFDPDNCTVTGTADPADGQEVVYFPCTKTAGAAADFVTVQAAIDWFKNRLLCAACKIDIVTSATYAETLVIEDVFCAAEGRLELEGDTRGMAGATWVDSAVITCQDANAGAGTCGLVNAGAVITVTGTGGNPDFDADGWVNGDTVEIRDNARAVTTYTIAGTLNNAITLTVAAPAVGNVGTSITLVPNTVIAPAGAGNAVEVIESRGILLDGLYLDATAGATGDGLYVHDGGGCKCENTLAEADNVGFNAEHGARLVANDGACSAITCNQGFRASANSPVDYGYACAIGCALYGFQSQHVSFLRAGYAVASGNTTGFYGSYFGVFSARDAYSLDNSGRGFDARYLSGGDVRDSRTLGSNGTDYRSTHNSYMMADNTNVGGPTYSPAVSDTEGNVFGIITFS